MENINGKKILFIITKSNLGGAQKYVYELACAAKDAGALVSVAVGGVGEKKGHIGPLVDKLTAQEIPVHLVKHFMRDISPLEDLYAFVELTKIIHAQQPDILHVTSSKAGGFGALAGRINRIKTIIFTSHGLTFDESWRPFYQRFAIKLLTWCTLLLAHKSIMISRDTYKKAKKLPFVKEKIYLIYNGIKQPLFLSKKEARDILLPHSNKHTTIWIGGIGELHPNKNWEALIEAMTLLPEKVQCIIIGEGEQRKILEEKITSLGLQERVILKGFIPDASLLLPALDIFILPSYKEGLPYVLLEAGLAKNAVACSNISGNTDIITHKKNGLLFSHTPESIATTIQILIEDTPLRAELSETLHNDILHTFSMERMIQQTTFLYNQHT